MFDVVILFAASVAFSAVLLFLFYQAQSREARGEITILAPAGLFFACWLSPANLMLLLVLLIAAWLLPVNTKPRTRLQVGVAVTVAVYALAIIPGAMEVLRRHHAREQYPIESLAQRLEYEREVVGDSTTAFASANPADRQLSKTVESRLRQTDFGHFDRSWRDLQLKQLHSWEADKFILSGGLGIARLFSVENMQLDYEDQVEQSTNDEEQSFFVIDGATVRSTAPVAEQSDSAVATPSQNQLLELHDEGSWRFVNPASLGYVAGKQKAAGFVSHRFSKARLPLGQTDPASGWKIARLELVSLLKHKEPRVYVSEELPQMEKLKSVPTRALHEFEQQALPKLWHEEDIVVAEEANEVLMLGALRARTECLDCHSVKRGQLLGAFSYSLRPAASIKLEFDNP